MRAEEIKRNRENQLAAARKKIVDSLDAYVNSIDDPYHTSEEVVKKATIRMLMEIEQSYLLLEKATKKTSYSNNDNEV